MANPDLVGNRFFSCPDGWTCNYTNCHMAEAAKMQEVGIEVFVLGSGETLTASLASAYADKQPWFRYYWAPTPILGKNPMLMVDVGPYDKDAFDCNASEDCSDLKISA
ncbi:glycine betaine ABC transporter substrate-binding protein [Defluviimonas sp. SAOS-178_SWC]|uniref:glycine betaine ABC transporter substrate-binding protein n=1 Tax=Defluviimonas sp. SAOS-178_SWC TaxID=3121287 RepID=UPI003221AC72